MNAPNWLGLTFRADDGPWLGAGGVTFLDDRQELDLRRGTVTNSGVPRYRELASRHLLPVETRCPAADSMLLVVETCQSHIRIAEAARTRVFKDGAWLAGPGTVTERPGWIGREFAIVANEGETVTVEKTVAIATSRDRAVGEAGAAAARRLEQSASWGAEGRIVGGVAE